MLVSSCTDVSTEPRVGPSPSEAPVEGGAPPVGKVTSALQTTPVILLSPTGGAVVSAMPTFTWDPNPGATDYDIYVNDSTGNRIDIRARAPANLGGCTPCTLTTSVALAGGSGRWWVRPNDVDGNGPWGTGETFAVGGATPPTPTNLATLAADSTPNFSWDESPSATGYNLWVNDASGFRYNTNLTPTCTAGVCSAEPATVLMPGNAEAWVRANSASGSSGWSTRLDFVVPGTPVVDIATNLGATSDPDSTFSWDSVPGATVYDVWVNDGTGFVTNSPVTDVAAGCVGGGQCSASLGLNLTLGPAVFWIRGRNAAATGPWSNRFDFTVSLPLPAQVGGLGGDPVNGVYTWNEAAFADDYEIWLREGNVSPTYNVVHTPGDGMLTCGGGTCTLTGGIVPAATSPGRFWIRGINAAGNGQWSTPYDF